MKQVKKKHSFWKKWHKYVGLVFSLFVIMFSISGIVMNHRELFAGCDVNRSVLPSSYRINNYNNGIIKGTLPFCDSILSWGVNGCYVSDKDFTHFREFSYGMPEGADRRKMCSVVISSDSVYYAATQYGLYKLVNSSWQNIPLNGLEERLSDITVKNDTLYILSRSQVYIVNAKTLAQSHYELTAPKDYRSKVTLFRTVWMLHSGELFGTVGKIFADFMAAVLIILSIGGIIHFFLPMRIRRRNRKQKASPHSASFMRFNLSWHKKIGLYLIAFTLFITITGMCLRPPLMIPLVMNSSAPLKHTAQYSENSFHDKLRAMRWDEDLSRWLVYTSDGWFSASSLSEKLTPMKGPEVSPMGLNVFVKDTNGEWITGSFSGIVRWNPATGNIRDYFTLKPYKKASGRPVGKLTVSGFTDDIAGKGRVIFAYDKGAMTALPECEKVLTKAPMSLWNCALEVHTGRCYTFLPGILSDMFVFLAGIILSLVLISGLIITLKRKHRNNNTENNDNANQLRQ